MDENKSPLASEMYEDLKDHTVFLRKMVVGLLIVIGVLVVALAGTNLYHTTNGASLKRSLLTRPRAPQIMSKAKTLEEFSMARVTVRRKKNGRSKGTRIKRINRKKKKP